ncbi:MAG TPA: hypothetical protein VNN99_14090 [Vicinamibacterales bacterium]|nr:hypothetical protein [Vicinamibacterales bacterium]
MTVNFSVDFDLDAAAPKWCMVSGCQEPTAFPGGGFCRKHGDKWAAQPHVQAVFKRWAAEEDARIEERILREIQARS